MRFLGCGRLVLALTMSVATVLTVGVSPAGSAPMSAYRDGIADARTVPAYLASSDPDRTVRVFSVDFWAREGERRYVTSQVVARQPWTTSDSALMAAASISCSPDNGGVTNAGATENLVRGTSTTFTPRFVYVVPRSGMVRCTLVVSGLRPRPNYSGPSSSNVWLVDKGSFLSVSEPMGSWTGSHASDARSRVLDRGERWTPIATVTRVPFGDTFEVVSDHKVTTCSSVGGSRDSSTLGHELCAGRVSTQGSRVRLVVSAVQLDRRGDACTTPQIFDRLRRVTSTVHHAMVFSKVLVSVSGAASCTRTFAIRGSLLQVGGADLMVHAPSERTSIVRH